VRISADTKLLFVAGKGGVGKTTLATSIALQLASRHPERQYTLISVDPAYSTKDVFAGGGERPRSNLRVETIATREKWEKLREKLGDEVERAVGAITPGNLTLAYDAEAMRKLLEIAPPGADEIFAVMRLADLAADESRALTVVDTAPTGHFLRLLDLPRTAGEWVREFMRILLRYRELIPPGKLGEELVSASRSLTYIERLLHSPRAAVILVTRPERIVVAETKRLQETLAARRIAVAGIVANYVTPENECPCDREMRGHEVRQMAALGEVEAIPRHEAPLVGLDDLARLFTVASD
jgi:arsenite-transporting ATPase